jgi:hypothetical protein
MVALHFENNYLFSQIIFKQEKKKKIIKEKKQKSKKFV